MENIKFIIPTWALSAMFNDDRSSFDERDEIVFNKFRERCKDLERGFFAIPDDLDNHYFAAHNDIDGYLGADVIEVYYYIYDNHQ